MHSRGGGTRMIFVPSSQRSVPTYSLACEYVTASVERCPRAILSTPGTSGYDISYNKVLRAVPHKTLRWGIF